MCIGFTLRIFYINISEMKKKTNSLFLLYMKPETVSIISGITDLPLKTHSL